MDWWLIIALVVGTLLGLLKVAAKNAVVTVQAKAFATALESLPEFTATQDCISAELTSAVAIDEGRRKVCLYTNSRALVVPYRDVLEVELFEDGASITRTSRKSQIGGALVGGVLFGGMGAVVGGLTGKRETSARSLTRIDLRITINSTSSPTHEFIFLNLPKPSPDVAAKAGALARHWQGVFRAVIEQGGDAADVIEPFPTLIDNESTTTAETPLRLPAKRPTGQAAPASDAEREEMQRYGITRVGNQYQFRGHRYDVLADAIAYARRQATKD